MSTSNMKTSVLTHGGAIAKRINPIQQLRRTVLSCLLWEKEFYEDGKEIANNITEAANNCDVEEVANLAFEARNLHGLRHVPLLLLLNVIKRGGKGTKHLIAKTIRRADDMTELLALYWAHGNERSKKPKGQGHLADRQLRDGLKIAFEKFDEYSISKYDKKDGAVRMRDVMFMSHPKPKNEEQAQFYKRIAQDQMKTPDTWEVRLSGGVNKKEAWTTLLRNTLDKNYKDRDGQLGYMAVLRNLRNMVDVDVDRGLIRDAILLRRGAQLVFPHRYVAAARACPQLEASIDVALLASIENLPKLSGTTCVLVDVSGSMDLRLSAKSGLTRLDAACALAALVNADDARVFSFSNQVVEVPARKGMAGIDCINKSQEHSGTKLTSAINFINSIKHSRLIVISDEQNTEYGMKTPDPVCKYAYMINVASNKNGIGYGKWTHVDGFSEAVLRFIPLFEQEMENYK